MVDYILGNYLVESGKISKAQLNAILQKQDSVRVKLGLIAVAEGYSPFNSDSLSLSSRLTV